MRKKLTAEDKRSIIIGIKVKPAIKEKLQWLSKRDATQMSTYVNNILERHVEQLTSIYKIDWDKELNEQ